ncbi:hypothetical protein, partial [Klebsiella pneumoniae]|uniref:hypothetical protein n=1 Tax=Klebsiella pneumoniae TaxID=573 RepID=UPI003458D6E4
MATLPIRSAAGSPRTRRAPFALALALTLPLAVAGCGGVPNNRMLDSVHHPVVEKSSYTFDVNTLPGGGLPVAEQTRLNGWFA